MATVSNEIFQDQLEQRRRRLLALSPATRSNGEVAGLLAEIDRALERLQQGTFGVCEECHGGIEADALLANPTLRICLDHFTSAQLRLLEHDLELAHQIQHRLLPQTAATIPGWNVAYHYQPAGLVSGDYVDLIFPQDAADEMLFLVGDVSGKGVAASMLMTQLHAMFRTLATVGQPLKKLLGSANQVLGESTISGQFATLIAGRANACGSLEIAGAGHVPGLLLNDSGITPIHASGIPLGISRASEYQTQTFRLKPGDSLVLYSDGLSEAENSAGDQYGESRLANFLAMQHARNAKDLLAATIQDLKEFSGEKKLADDLTVMVLHRDHSAAA